MSEWREIPGFPGYKVSSSGEIEGRLGPLKAQKLNSGYLGITLSGPMGKLTTTVQRVVLFAFVGPPPTEDHEANHKNGDRFDNAPANLEWVTKQENMDHARLVLGSKFGRAPLERMELVQPKPGAHRGRIVWELDGHVLAVVTLHQPPRRKGGKRSRVDSFEARSEWGDILAVGGWHAVHSAAVARVIPRQLSRDAVAGMA